MLEETNRLLQYMNERNEYLGRLKRLTAEGKQLKTMIDNCNCKIKQQKNLLEKMKAN